MKIAILGTKGIPNNYGGYEQFAEYISARLLERGHSVTVYNPHYHKFRGDEYNGVKIIRKYSPEKWIGGAANIIYDHLCLKDALKKDFDIIYEAGYHSVALSYRALKVRDLKKPVILTNMDGLEWRRSKWNKSIQNIIKKLEKIAVQHSPYLISDNRGIEQYLMEKYNAASYYIPYGADPVEEFNPAFLPDYGVERGKYFMLVARLEPENNVETIISGHLKSTSSYPLLVIGNHNTRFGNYLKNKFSNSKVKFVGGVYNKSHLDSLRHFALVYFHGHSVGGTNPSLLEAMGSQSFIVAHRNPFNEAILGDDAQYFEGADEVRELVENAESASVELRAKFLAENLGKIKTLYKWSGVVQQHERLFQALLDKSAGLKHKGDKQPLVRIFQFLGL